MSTTDIGNLMSALFGSAIYATVEEGYYSYPGNKRPIITKEYAKFFSGEKISRKVNFSYAPQVFTVSVFGVLMGSSLYNVFKK